MEKYKLFTHTDLDGVACAILAQFIWEDNVEVEYCNYDDIDEKVNEIINSGKYSEYKQIFITDISVSLDTAKTISGISPNIFYLLDHHPTALILNMYEWCKVQIENTGKIKTCGAELFYHYLTSRKYLPETGFLRKFVSQVRDWDTWRWVTLKEAGIESKQLNDLLHIRGREYFVEWALEDLHQGFYPLPLGADLILLKLHQKEIDDYISQKNNEMIVTIVAGMRCGVVFADRFVSELGNRICELNPQVDFVAIVNMGSGNISYRTTKNHIDLGKNVAALFGGGGHPKSAGSTMEKGIAEEVVDLIWSRKEYI